MPDDGDQRPPDPWMNNNQNAMDEALTAALLIWGPMLFLLFLAMLVITFL